MAAFFAKVQIPIDPLNKALAQMSEQRQDPRQASMEFLKAHPDIWKPWLPEDVAARVSASLN
ncbi:hypothetical protein D3C85_901160 [compost metagenome]